MRALVLCLCNHITRVDRKREGGGRMDGWMISGKGASRRNMGDTRSERTELTQRWPPYAADKKLKRLELGGGVVNSPHGEHHVRPAVV